MLHLSKNITPAFDYRPTGHNRNMSSIDGQIAMYILNKLEDLKSQRQSIEEVWLYCYAQYLNTKESRDLLKLRMHQLLGEAKENWQHNINTGKAWEITETIFSYLYLSLFPNNQWLHLQGKTAGFIQLARIIREYMLDRLDQWKFYAQIESYLRQMIIIGTSCMAIPWSQTGVGGEIEFETLDMFDVWVDTLERDYDNSPLIRRVVKTKGEIIQLVRTGKYSNITEEEVVRLSGTDDYAEVNRMNKDIQRHFRGIEVPVYSMHDKVTLYEFWGDIVLADVEYKNVRAVICGNKLIVFEKNSYECGKPFVIDNYVTVVRQNYGMSPLQASLGLITATNNSINQLLDGVELAVNPWYTVKRSAAVDPNRTKLAPGEMLEVDEHDDVRPSIPPQNNFNLSVSSMITLESLIEKNSGTVPLIGAGQPRGGERVTAEEIRAVVDAGGTRLSSIFKHVERFSIIAMMYKTYCNIRQFTKIEQEVTIQTSPNSYEYWVLEPNDFKGEWVIKVRGASFLIEQRDYVDKRLQLLELAQKSELVANKLNQDQLILDIVTNWGFDNPEIYLVQQEAINTVEGNNQNTDDSIQQMVGSAGEQALLQQIQADGGVNFFSQLTNTPNNYDSSTTQPTVSTVNTGTSPATNGVSAPINGTAL